MNALGKPIVDLDAVSGAPPVPPDGCVSDRGRLAALARRHGYVAPAFLLTLALFAWLVTYGDWRPFDQEQLSYYYDALGDSLLDGRMDVPRNAIAFEAFVRDGKFYGYFGMTPALWRIPLNQMFPQLWGQWSRASMMAACVLSLWLAYRLAFRLAAASGNPPKATRWPLCLFLLAAGCGSTILFLASRSFVYHEASLWGGTLSLGTAYFLFRYAREGAARQLAVAAVAAFLAIFARPTAGAGAVTAILGASMLLAARFAAGRGADGWWRRWLARFADAWGTPRVARPGRDALIAASAVALTAAFYFGTNYLKFHTWAALPLDRYVQYQQDPSRLRLTEGKQLHLANFPNGLVAYFGRPGIDVREQFPWVCLQRPARVIGAARIDVNDWSSSVPASMPALFALACWGGVLLVRGRSEDARRLRLPALSLGLGGAVVLCTVGICQRYVHDFYPALTVAAAAGAFGLARMRTPRAARIALLGTLTVLVVLSIGIELAFALQYQRELSRGVPDEKRAEYRHWQERLGGGTPPGKSALAPAEGNRYARS